MVLITQNGTIGNTENADCID